MKGKPKTKSGCRTCKARKVKCDEGRPSCQRCVSTGRYCDGYGIWGGGTDAAAKSLSLAAPKDHKIDVSRPLVSTLPSSLNPDEKRHFEWFKLRTAVKLPGTFVSGFWRTLLLQTGSSDPAVLHAILAISSVQNRRCVEFNNEPIRSSPDGEEQFALRHYLKAIACIRPNLASRDRSQSRAALVACTIFTCLEFLRGHFDASQTHFQNGLSVMQHLGMLVEEEDNVLRFKSSSDAVDDWIVEVFSRLHLQIEFLKYGGPGQCLVLRLDGSGQPTRPCQNIYVAWRDLGILFNEVIYVRNQTLKRRNDPVNNMHMDKLNKHSQQVREGLQQWRDRVEALRKAPLIRTSVEIRRAMHICHSILSTYHTMARIMLEACIADSGEMDYDSHTYLFMSMLANHLDIRHVVDVPTHHERARPGQRLQVSHSIADLGSTAPLYYIATKCRVHRIRLQAIRLMDSVEHREGIWDTQVAGCAARKVMEMEEGDFYSSFQDADDFDFLVQPTAEEVEALPTLPSSHRMDHVEMVMSGSPMDSIILTCTKGRQAQDQLNFVSTYDVRTQAWMDLEALDPLTPGEWNVDYLTSSDLSSNGLTPREFSPMSA